ncbi:MAG: hypothetical protein MI975_25330 [Cytophagales bacterium]|nr:hypothetical protein [Cytophagales bacterium]
MALRALKHYEVYELARNEKFVATVQAVVLEKCQVRKSEIIGAIKLGAFHDRTEKDKRDYLFSKQSLESGQISNNVGIARLFAIKLLHDNVDIDMEDAGSAAWNPQSVTNTLVDSGLLAIGNNQFEAVWTDWVSNIDIDNQYFVIMETFIAKVKNALMKAATAAIGEDTSTYNQTVVDKRHAFATELLKDPNKHAESLKFAIASNAALSEFSTSADIEFTVNSMFNDFAGVTKAELDLV